MPSPTRVLFVAPFGLRQKTTVWARTLPLARELVGHGFAPTLLIPPWDSPQDSGACWIDGGVEIAHVATDCGPPSILGRLLRELDRRSPQIVHLIKPRAYAGLVQWALWQRRTLGGRGPTLILDIDDWEQAWNEVNQYPAPLARFLSWQEEWGLRHADGITAASHWLVGRATERAQRSEILLLPNGVAPCDQPPSPPAGRSGAPRILFFTRYVEVQPRWLAEMANSLLEALPDATLILAGRPLRPDGDSAFRSAFSVQERTASAQVLWIANVEPPTVPGLYAAADVALFPADPVPLQQAKCSVRLANTLLNGVPVVASAVGEQAYYGAQGSTRLVPSNASPAAFASAVVETLANPAAAREMVRRAHEHLTANYLWPDLAARLARYYATFTAMA